MTWTMNRKLLEMIMLCCEDLSSQSSRFSHRQNSKGFKARAKTSNFDEGSKISDLISSLIFIRVEGIFGRLEKFSFKRIPNKILSNSSKAPNTTLQTHLKTKFKFLHFFHFLLLEKINRGRKSRMKKGKILRRENECKGEDYRTPKAKHWLNINWNDKSIDAVLWVINHSLSGKAFCSANFSFSSTFFMAFQHETYLETFNFLLFTA